MADQRHDQGMHEGESEGVTMKFKKPNDYQSAQPAVLDAPVALEKSVASNDWSCVGCEGHAQVIHRGTTYCKECYRTRAYTGNLVD